MFDLKELEELCTKFLKYRIDSKNLVHFLKNTTKYDTPDLKEVVISRFVKDAANGFESEQVLEVKEAEAEKKAEAEKVEVEKQVQEEKKAEDENKVDAVKKEEESKNEASNKETSKKEELQFSIPLLGMARRKSSL